MISEIISGLTGPVLYHNQLDMIRSLNIILLKDMIDWNFCYVIDILYWHEHDSYKSILIVYPG